MSIENIAGKTKVELFYDTQLITDEVNGLVGEIKYNPNFDKSVSGVANRWTVGWFSSTLGINEKTKRPARGDDVHVRII